MLKLEGAKTLIETKTRIKTNKNYSGTVNVHRSTLSEAFGLLDMLPGCFILLPYNYIDWSGFFFLFCLPQTSLTGSTLTYIHC